VDEGLAPLLAVDDGGLGAAFAALAGGGDGRSHLGDEGFGFRLRVDYGGDEADVFVDVGEGVGGEGQDWEAGFEDRGQGFEAVGHAGEDQVGFCGEDLFGVGGPTVVENVGVLLGQFGEGFEAVFCAGAEGVEFFEGGEGDGDGGLEGGYSHEIGVSHFGEDYLSGRRPPSPGEKCAKSSKERL